MKIIIVGGVAGGMSAATRLRRLMEDAEITLFEKDPFVSFANCGLPYYVSGEIANRDSLLVQTPESLKARFNLDVRTPMEFRRGHIKNAKNVPLTEIGSYTPTTKETLYVICHSGVRSKMAAKKLKKKGYDVINVRGGMSAWTGKVI